jgi:hypothetical protein
MTSPLFLARAEPLPVVGVAALGPHVRTLAERALSLSDAQLVTLTGVAGPTAAVVLGPLEALPWFDGALYLGAQGALLWPTWAEPNVHPLLLERALRRSLEAPDGPLALLVPSLAQAQKPLVVPLVTARPLSRERLQALKAGA